MSAEKPLAGRVAWVTGSSRGLGRVVATELCRLGAAVAIHGTRPDSPKSFDEGESMEQVARDVAAEAGGDAVPVWGDVTDEAAVRRMADEVRARPGPVDVLAATSAPAAPASAAAAGPAPTTASASPWPTSRPCSTATCSRASSAAGRWPRR